MVGSSQAGAEEGLERQLDADEAHDDEDPGEKVGQHHDTRTTIISKGSSEFAVRVTVPVIGSEDQDALQDKEKGNKDADHGQEHQNLPARERDYVLSPKIPDAFDPSHNSGRRLGVVVALCDFVLSRTRGFVRSPWRPQNCSASRRACDGDTDHGLQTAQWESSLKERKIGPQNHSKKCDAQI
uniref:Uncharacterized protein n=1 Tax=Steinernema glaseri TaxID=37863 RepID=A0A1I7XW29_9BILA